jgi:hypothetical protein
MKIKIIIPNLIFLFGLLVLNVFGQTSVFTIKVTPPTNLPPCKQRIEKIERNGRTVTIFTALIPNTLKLDFEEIRVGTEGDDFIFSFEAPSGFCKTTADGYEIEISGAAATVVNPTVAAPTATPVPTGIDTGLSVQDEITNAVKDAEEESKEVDLSIPEAPGFTILGLTPQEVTRPTTPREFATTLINSLDRNGNFQSGIAIDTAPYQLFFSRRINRDRDYIPPQKDKLIEQDGELIDNRSREPLKGYFTRFLWRTQFSLATTKGTTKDDKSARIGAGFNFTFFDFGDPNTDFKLRDCQTNVVLTLDDKAAQDLGFKDFFDSRITPDDHRKINARKMFLVTQDYILKQYDKCVEESEKRNFGKSSFGVGVAGSWISKDGDSAKFTNNGQGLWASLNYGFEGIPGLRCTEKEIEEDNRCITPQLIFHFRRRVKETVPNPLIDGMFTTKDSNLFGMRLRVGVPKWSVNFEGVYRAERYAGRTSSSSIQASIGADYKLAKNLYLNFSIGGETKESNIPGTGKVFVRTSFNWGTSQKPL